MLIGIFKMVYKLFLYALALALGLANIDGQKFTVYNASGVTYGYNNVI